METGSPRCSWNVTPFSAANETTGGKQRQRLDRDNTLSQQDLAEVLIRRTCPVGPVTHLQK